MQSGDDLLALPTEIGLALHVLEGAAAAGAKIAAHRRDPVRAWLDHLKQRRTVLALLQRDRHLLAWTVNGT